MPRRCLIPKLVDRIALKLNKPPKYIGEQISRRARKLGVPGDVAQLIWAQQLGIAIGNHLAKVSPEVRQEVRSIASITPQERRFVVQTQNTSPPRNRKASSITVGTIRNLVRDDDLFGRCKDLILAKKHFDRVVREATTVLDDRLKTKSGIVGQNPAQLVARALNSDPAKAVLQVSSDPAEQEGVYSICKGIMLAFRNKAHHGLSENFTREDALRFCGFVDIVLGIIEQAVIHHDRT